MRNVILRRGVVLLAAVALLALSTVALAHGHSKLNSADDSHCALCMAMHGTRAMVASAVVTLNFTPIQFSTVIRSAGSCPVLVYGSAAQGRAPPFTTSLS